MTTHRRGAHRQLPRKRLLSISVVLLAATVGATVALVVVRPGGQAPALLTLTSDLKPAVADWGSRSPINVGTSFTADTDTVVGGVRFWRPAASRGPYTALMYGPDRRELARVGLGGTDRTGWTSIGFPRPVPVRAGGTYVVSVFLPSGHWPVTLQFFQNGPRRIGPVSETHGVYLFASGPRYPASVTSDLLFVDPLFSSVASPAQSADQPVPAPSGPTATATTTPTTTPTARRTAVPGTGPATTGPPVTGGPGAAATTPVPSPAEPSPPPPVRPTPPFNSTCRVKPGDATTGPAAGVTRHARAGGMFTKDGAVFDGVDFQGSVQIQADDVTIRNSTVKGSIVVRGDRVTIDRVAASGIGITGGADHVVQYADLAGGIDGIHVDSSRGLTTNLTLRYNYVHDRKPPPDAHVDGLQVRGVRGLRIECNNFDLTPYDRTQNGVIFLEGQNGGNHDIVIDRNWLDGGGSTLFVDATDLRVTNNRFGRGYHFRVCRVRSGGVEGAGSFLSSGNVWDDSSQPLQLCGQG